MVGFKGFCYIRSLEMKHIELVSLIKYYVPTTLLRTKVFYLTKQFSVLLYRYYL